MILEFVKYVMEEATQNFFISFRDGDPRETLFDSFNAHFEADSHFNEVLLLLTSRISEISANDKAKMVELEKLCNGKRFLD